MPFECSFAGIGLPLATPELQQWLDSLVSLDTVTEFEYLPGWPSRVEHLPLPPTPKKRPIRLGVLVWPQNASRFAVFHCVCTKAKLDLIRAAVGDPMTPKPFVMDDGREETVGGVVVSRIETDLYLLPPRELANCNLSATSTLTGEPLYLLTLVDVRFYDHWRAGSVATPASWTQLFGFVGTVLGRSVTTETIDADYQSPSDRWKEYYGPAAAVLDAACTAVGQRYSRKLDGTERTQTYTTALASVASQFETFSKVAGGYTPRQDLKRYVPESVTVLFRKTTGGSQQKDPYANAQPLAGLVTLPEYGTSTGVAGTSVGVVVDYTYDGTNAGTCEDVAVRAATDWYGWQLADLDIVYGGVVAWEPTGADYETEWAFGYGPGGDPTATTRVRRQPWNWETRGDWKKPTPATIHVFRYSCSGGSLVETVYTVEIDADGTATTVSNSSCSFTTSIAGLAVTFTGTYTPGPSPATLSWDFGDSSSGSGASPSHTYGAAGTYTVTLTVTYGDGFVVSHSASVTVS